MAAKNQNFSSKLNRGEYNNKMAYSAGFEAYKAEDLRIDKQVKVDMLEELGLTNHPKAEKAYAMACDRGHSDGYEAIFAELSELAGLIK